MESFYIKQESSEPPSAPLKCVVSEDWSVQIKEEVTRVADSPGYITTESTGDDEGDIKQEETSQTSSTVTPTAGREQLESVVDLDSHQTHPSKSPGVTKQTAEERGLLPQCQ
ncbi:hypothetical protein EOD39_12962 [Acipenser ruthenus]|uniref:Uncharacterized protein n=1 Tax=Acipenser ruthenus TaxID=7906 RepID=A0A662YPS3_ACIRT|nr:hypothetical protein EOD39_12962 [Acipenser ruthenus]